MSIPPGLPAIGTIRQSEGASPWLFASASIGAAARMRSASSTAKAKWSTGCATGHDREGLATLVAWLKRHAAPGETKVAIERPSGLLVDALVEAGFVVTPIHPNVVNACRPRYRAAAAKSDPGDAYILADILRTDGHRLRALEPQSDAIKGLRSLVRGRDDLVAARVALANQLTRPAG